MIDTTKEKLIPLDDARSLAIFPNPPSFQTMLRWSQAGYRGRVQLETKRVGRTLCTSAEAVHRFVDRMSEGIKTTDRTQSQSLVANDAARQYLEAVGIAR